MLSHCLEAKAAHWAVMSTTRHQAPNTGFVAGGMVMRLTVGNTAYVILVQGSAWWWGRAMSNCDDKVRQHTRRAATHA